MMDKITGILNKVTSYVPKLKVSRSLPLWVVIIFAIMYLSLHALFIFAWLDDWGNTGKPDLVMLDIFTKNATVAISVITFIVTFLVDKNNNGIPDAAEKEDPK